MIIKIIASGCTNCKTSEKRTFEAVELLNIDALVEKVTDFPKSASYGIMRTLGLAIDESTSISGFVPAVINIRNFFSLNGVHDEKAH